MKLQTETLSNSLTNGRTLAKNTAWNLIGQGAPMLVAIFTIPVLVKHLGIDRFGVLNLAWMAIGYFTMFDLGLGRALTKLVAERLGGKGEEELPTLIWTASVMMVALGMAGAVATWLLSPLLVTQILKVPEAIRKETLQTFYLLAASIPVVISTSGFRGVLEAVQRFDLTNAVRIPMGIFTFAGPLLVLPFTRDLFWVTVVLVAGRCIAWGVHLVLCLRVMPALKSGIVVKQSVVRPLLGFGGWMTVSNVVSPLLVYLDRFLIGAVVSVAAVAYYATPWEIVTKILIIPGALVGVLFPAFSATFAWEPGRAAAIYRRGQKYIFLLLFPIILLVVTFAREGLMFWLGADFADNGFRVMQLLAAGVLVNAMAVVPFSFIQGAGRPDLTAKLHLLEALLYLPGLWWLTAGYGIVGAAIAWLLRVCVDAVILVVFVGRLIDASGAKPLIPITGSFLAVASLSVAMLSMPIIVKLTIVVLILMVFMVIGWFYMVDHTERLSFTSWMNGYIKKN